VCSPGSTECSSGTQYIQCNSSGAWGSPTACTYVCNGTGPGSGCGGVCTPGTKRCSGAYIQTCSSSGAWANSITCSVCNGVSGECGTCLGAPTCLMEVTVGYSEECECP
jgi:hypothetical protein